MIKLGIVAICFFISNLTLGYEFKGQTGKLELSTPRSFKLYRNFLGLPFVLIKKENNNKKTSISITPTGLQKLDLDPKLLKNNYDKYKSGRKKWAKKRKLKILNFLVFESFVNKTRNKIVSAGYRYENIEGVKNEERSYYILCPKESFQIKVLTEINSLTTKFFESTVKDLKSSSCK